MPKEQELAGVGIGLRSPHVPQILATKPKIDWLEVLADNYLSTTQESYRQLEEICQLYPISMHCVGMSLGSSDKLDREYLKRISALAQRYNARLISDHLAWTSIHGIQTHDLLPLPYTEEAVEHVSKRIKIVQHILDQQILIENVSCYLNFKEATLKEWEFVAAVAERADCNILLDLNNIYLNSVNNGFEVMDYLNALPAKRVKQIHLGGHEQQGDVLIDTHSSAVAYDVWEIYRASRAIFPNIPCLIEWDNEIPELAVLLDQAKKAASFC